jgi:hypothetical protein
MAFSIDALQCPQFMSGTLNLIITISFLLLPSRPLPYGKVNARKNSSMHLFTFQLMEPLCEGGSE